MRLVWSERALSDLREIRAYIAEDNPKAARNWIAKLRKRARQAVQAPYSGRVVPEIDREDVRELFLYFRTPSFSNLFTHHNNKPRLEDAEESERDPDVLFEEWGLEQVGKELTRVRSLLRKEREPREEENDDAEGF